MTTPSITVEFGSLIKTLRGRPNLNDLELGNYLTTVINKAREINELSANRRANALMDCLADIENAARHAQWRLLRICDEKAPRISEGSESDRPKRGREQGKSERDPGGIDPEGVSQR